MNYLQLVQQLHSDVGAAGNAPASVVGQTGEAGRLVNWIKFADWYIQNLYTRWKFLRVAFSVNSTAFTSTISKPAVLKQWDLDTFIYSQSPIEVVEYDTVKSEYFDTTIFGPPSRLIVMPNKDLRVDPIPSAVYAFTGDYYKLPIFLAANADISLIPEEFHMTILGRAMILYSNYENAPEIKTQGQEIYGEFFPRLFDDQITTQYDNSGYKGTGGYFEVVAE